MSLPSLLHTLSLLAGMECLVLCNHSAAVTDTLVCYQHCVGHWSETQHHRGCCEESLLHSSQTQYISQTPCYTVWLSFPKVIVFQNAFTKALGTHGLKYSLAESLRSLFWKRLRFCAPPRSSILYSGREGCVILTVTVALFLTQLIKSVCYQCCL